jgi:hypothetical protein
MIRTSDGPVNFACVRLHGTTYESPVNVAARFEQIACGSGRHTRSWHNIPEAGACQCFRVRPRSAEQGAVRHSIGSPSVGCEGDGAENPIFVETIERRGYRWIGPVLLPVPTKEEPSGAAVV